MIGMAIDDIKDDQNRWFAKGFMAFWNQSNEAIEFDGHVTDFANRFERYVHKSTISDLFNGVEGRSFPGKKAQQVLASHFKKTRIDMINVGKAMESENHGLDIIKEVSAPESASKGEDETKRVGEAEKDMILVVKDFNDRIEKLNQRIIELEKENERLRLSAPTVSSHPRKGKAAPSHQ